MTPDGCVYTIICCLMLFYSKCSRNPVDDIAKRVTEMGDTFCEKFVQVMSLAVTDVEYFSYFVSSKLIVFFMYADWYFMCYMTDASVAEICLNHW